MATIGITVSNTRAFPSQLEEIKQFNKFVLIKPGELQQKIDECEILYIWNLICEELKICLINNAILPRCIFIARQGLDSELNKLASNRDIEIQYARGAFSDSISEFILASSYMLSKNLHKTVINRSWIKHEQMPVSGSTALLLGRGDISTVSKNLLQNNNINTQQIGKLNVIKIANGDTSSDDRAFLEQVDHIVCCLPLEVSTQNILNDTFFSHFNNSNFINISRGGVLNEGSLINALNNYNLRAAVLDAFNQEPLPHDNELWLDDRIVISPHQSYKSPNWEHLLHSSFINFLKSHGTIDTK